MIRGNHHAGMLLAGAPLRSRVVVSTRTGFVTNPTHFSEGGGIFMNPVNKHFPRTVLLAAALVVLGLAGCQSYGAPPATGGDDVASARERIIEQDAGKVVYWMLPGPRQLSEAVFGTPDNPKMLLEPKLAAAKQAVQAGKMPPAVPDTLQKVPILVGVPMKARTPDDNGHWWIEAPTPFSDDGRIISGEFTAHYVDRVQEDPPGPPGKTPDSAQMTAKFTDPAGNHYRVVLEHVVKPPFPGYNTEGGVMIDSYHHGATGTGTPLMPKVRTYAAFWGVGAVYVNDELVTPNQVMHMMTTEVVRDKDYHLALEEEMPLAPEDRIVKSQAHHTHLIIFPFKAVEGQGPVFAPLKTAFMLPNGKPQPFMHIMFEQDRIVQ